MFGYYDGNSKGLRLLRFAYDCERRGFILARDKALLDARKYLASDPFYTWVIDKVIAAGRADD